MVPISRRRRTTRRISPISAAFLALALLFLIGFGGDILRVLSGVLSVIFLLLGVPYPPINAEIANSFLVIMYNCMCGFGVVAWIWVLIAASQTLLPVRYFRGDAPHRTPALRPNLFSGHRTAPSQQNQQEPGAVEEVLRTGWQLILHVLKMHGPAVFIRNGEYQMEAEESRRRGIGVTVVDFNSAVVLEEQIPRPSIALPFRNMLNQVLEFFHLMDHRQNFRVRGPGVVFMRPGEQIRNAVDLRPQTRTRPGTNAHTRDGLEVTSVVVSAFSIGQEPEVLQLTCSSNPEQPNFQFIRLETLPGGRIQVQHITDELLPLDNEQLQATVRELTRTQAWQPFTPLPEPPTFPVFDRDRVFSAVIHQARRTDGVPVPWQELPGNVAAGIFRELVMNWDFNSLFNVPGITPPPDSSTFRRMVHEYGFNQSPDGSGDPPILRIRQQLARQMRNLGILSFRLVINRDRSPLAAGKYNPGRLLVSPVMPFTSSQVLRDRGIRMRFCTVSDPMPAPAVYQQRLQNWRAMWQSELEMREAINQLESSRVYINTRLDIERNLGRTLNQIINQTTLPREAVALRLLQALETAAADPEVSRLLPGETVRMLENIHDWMIPEDRPGFNRGGSPPAPMPTLPGTAQPAQTLPAPPSQQALTPPTEQGETPLPAVLPNAGQLSQRRVLTPPEEEAQEDDGDE